MTFSLAHPNRRFNTALPVSMLRDWLRKHATLVAIDRLDDHMLRDIGLQTGRERPVPRHEAASRITQMSWR